MTITYSTFNAISDCPLHFDGCGTLNSKKTYASCDMAVDVGVSVKVKELLLPSIDMSIMNRGSSIRGGNAASRGKFLSAV